MRTMSGAFPRGGMKSSTLTAPVSDSHSVSSTSVCGRYRRLPSQASMRGATIQRPCSGVPSSAAKQAPESKRGKQAQSIEPSRPTSAAVWRSPIRP